MSQMNPERWARVRALLEQVMPLPPEERVAALKAAESDPEIVADAQRLLAFDDQSSALFAVESWQQRQQRTAVEVSLTGTVLGNYRLQEEIGRGGMGTVYKAQRADDQYQQQVAIKILQEGIFSESLARRFRQERQILAQLQHPGIARLLDGGVLPDARPYLVLEYVDGVPIDRFCTDHKLDTEARLRLFLRVAEIVQSAHQQLVLHLDLKPANILVTTAGEPRLLDFGIARILQDQVDNQAEATLRLLTPRYASPEQIAGAPLGVASDVFSLATLLYRLLTGMLPYPLEDASPLEAARILQTVAPAVPSQIDPAHRDQLAGDLDTILLQALRKEPERRYSTVAAFAADIARHLQSQPVLAHADTLRYRAGKFIRRNRITVAAAALVAVVLIVSTVLVARSAVVARRERATAERRLADVRALAHSYIYDLIPALNPIPGTLATRKIMAANALQYLTAMSKERSADPTIEKEVAAGYFAIGRMEGDPNVQNLGNRPAAMDAFQRGLAMEQSFARKDPNDPVIRAHISALLNAIGQLREAEGNIQEAARMHAEAWQTAQPLIAGHVFARYPQIANTAYFESMDFAYDGVWSMADPATGLEWILKAEATLNDFGKALPAAAKKPSMIAEMVYIQQVKAGDLSALGRDDEARAIYERLVPMMDNMKAPDGVFTEVRRALHSDYASYLYEHGDLAGATRMTEIARPEAKHETGESEGDDLFTQVSLASEYGWAGVIDLSNNQLVKGRAEMKACLDNYRAMHQRAPDFMWTTSGLVSNLLAFADLPQLPPAEARGMFLEVIELTRPYIASHPQVLSAQVDEAHAHAGLAGIARRQHDSATRAVEAESAVRLLKPILEARPQLASAKKLLVSASANR